MWHMDTKFEHSRYPRGGVAPTRHDLALFNYKEKKKYQPKRR